MTKQELISELVKFVSSEYDDQLEHEIDENFNLGYVLDSFNYVSLQNKFEKLLNQKVRPEHQNKFAFKATIRELGDLAEQYGVNA